MTDLIIKSLGMYGLTIVISMLAALLIKLIVVVIAKSEERRKQQARDRAVAAAEPVLSGQVDPRHVAAISAAVYAMLGSHRIVHIAGSRNMPAWAAEGKRQLQTSHNVRRTK